MRNIIGLLYRYNAIFIFVALQVIALILLINFNPYQRTSYFNSSNLIVGGMKDITHSINEPFIAKKENRLLRSENAELRKQLPESFYPLENNLVKVNDSLYEEQYDYVEAQVIDFSYTRKRNYILLNVGRDKGVQEEMGVIGPNGVVGFVKDVSAKYALVVPLINPDFNTGVSIKTSNYSGIIAWDGDDYRFGALEELSKTSPINIGDSIITKGGKGRFPKGIQVGVIEDYEVVPGRNDYEIKVSLSTDFSNIRYAYVVVNRFQEELNDLRSLIPNDDE